MNRRALRTPTGTQVAVFYSGRLRIPGHQIWFALYCMLRGRMRLLDIAPECGQLDMAVTVALALAFAAVSTSLPISNGLTQAS